MAHRPLHPVLGETSLELKCLGLFGAFLLLVITPIVLSYWYVTGRVVTERNRVTGHLWADASMLFTHWKGLQDWMPVRARIRSNATRGGKGGKNSFLRR